MFRALLSCVLSYVPPRGSRKSRIPTLLFGSAPARRVLLRLITNDNATEIARLKRMAIVHPRKTFVLMFIYFNVKLI